MNNENTPASQLPFMDKVKDKIKNSFVDLIPEEQWDAMVQAEIDNFFEKPVRLNVNEEKQYGQNKTTQTFLTDENDNHVGTAFRQLVWDECIVKTREHIQSKYMQDHVSEILSNNATTMEEGTKDIIEEAVPAAMAKFFSGMMTNMKWQLQQDIQIMGNGLR